MFNRFLSPRTARLSAAFLTAAVAASARATVLDDIGITGLRAIQPSLTGTGVTVAQPEALIATDAFEVNRVSASNAGVAINYINGNGTVATTFPNAVGVESSHANSVGYDFYGTVVGPAPGIAMVVNYDANYFVSNVVFSLTPMTSKVANESFVFNSIPDADAAVVLQLYDNYVTTYSTIIVTAVGNTSNAIQLPSAAYNVISVAAIGGATGNGPNSDGRSKPDIAAPGSATSFATPLVSGVATVLYQAAARGDGGAGTSGTAVDSMVIKALMLNGATKTPGWFHTTTAPLYTVTGAGEVNALTAYQNLAAGTRGPTLNELVALNAVHNPVSTGTAVGSQGWIRRANINSSDTQDGVDHFLIDLSSGGSLFTLNATLTWNREYNDGIAQNVPNAPVSKINNLDFYLYDALTNTLVASSISGIDNVEQLASIVLPSGKYDLQVLKRGGTVGSTNVTNSTTSYFTETYGMAWNASAINTAGTTITSPNSFLEFSKTRTVSGVANINSVQIDPLANVSLNIMNAGTVINNGTVNFLNTNAQTSFSNFSGTGGITQAGTGTTTLSGSILSTGPMAVNAGKLILSELPPSVARGTSAVVVQMSALTVSPGATLNITNHDLVIHNGDLSAIAALVKNGATANYDWSGNGITSSTAGANGFAIGYGKAGDIGIGGTMWDGVLLSDSDVLVKMTYFGDANLDGVVDSVDYSYFQAGYPGPGNYTIGDFDYSGVVDSVDFSFFQAGYPSSTPLGGLQNVDGTSGLSTLVGTGGINAAPEPGSLAIFSMGLILLTRSRRSRARN